MLQNIAGAYVDVAELTSFNDIAYLAAHPEDQKISQSPITAFLAEVFPDKDLARADVGLRVDFVVTRQDGSAVRLHSHQSKEAQVTEGTLEAWRSGDVPIHAEVHRAVQEVKRRNDASRVQQV